MKPAIRESDPEKWETAQGVLRLLRLSLQLLASDAQSQINHFLPHTVVLTDEMALDFEHWNLCVPTYWELSEEHVITLAALDDFLSRMSGSLNQAFWADEALSTDVRWEEVRILARAALTAFGWPSEKPPPARWSGNALLDGIEG